MLYWFKFRNFISYKSLFSIAKRTYWVAEESMNNVKDVFPELRDKWDLGVKEMRENRGYTSLTL